MLLMQLLLILLVLKHFLSTFCIKCNPVFANGPKSLLKNPPDCPIWSSWVFNNFMLAEKLFLKALRSFETCVLVNNNLCRKLFLSLRSSAIFGQIFKATSIPFFIPHFKLLIWELVKKTLRLKYYIESFYIDTILKQRKLQYFDSSLSKI